ncbi:MAG: hypothetical protein GY787_31205 [Alteromonadales bacterium]|nr:hypothetical protein [Alteromonadales bacterium]
MYPKFADNYQSNVIAVALFDFELIFTLKTSAQYMLVEILVLSILGIYGDHIRGDLVGDGGVNDLSNLTNLFYFN